MYLKNDSLIVIIGGGPAGASCAITLAKLAQKSNLRLQIIVYEGKLFEVHPQYNQCLGILSPPIEEIFSEKLNLPFPYQLIQRKISGYFLHSPNKKILLEEEKEISLAVRRVTFDNYLLNKAKEFGVEVVHSRVTDLEFSENKIMVYSESDYRRADVVIGAFGLDDGSIKIFERCTRYKSPPFLNTIVTKIHPQMEFMDNFGNFIYAFLPLLKDIEFAAVVPKWNHLTIVVAGAKVSSFSMDRFLNLDQVKALLPKNFPLSPTSLDYYKGKFPVSLAADFFGDRYLIVGDAAGLVRPFKGKGVNAAILSGIKAAETIINYGVSFKAFYGYRQKIKEIFQDRFYGKIIRFLAVNSAKLGYLDEIIEFAKRDRVLKRALFDCVSAHRSFRDIFRNVFSLKRILRLSSALVKAMFFKIPFFFFRKRR